MTANQRRPGFRLPWSSETDGPAEEGDSTTPATEVNVESTPAAHVAESATAASRPAPTSRAPQPTGTARTDATPTEDAPIAAVETPATDAAEAPAAEPDAATVAGEPVTEAKDAAPSVQPADSGGGDDFMRELVAAMRRVADEARQGGLAELRSRADEQVHALETDAERRREDLRARAETDVAGVGDWAKAEAERIKAEAEARVVARRAQLEQQLAADATRTDSDTKALRDRVAEYERELEAFHAQLTEINDPAAFAAAAKRMPRPPKLAGGVAPAANAAGDHAQVEPTTGASNGVAATQPEVHPAEEEVLAARLAQLDATLPEAEAAAAPASAEPVTTEVVVKGLGSFGAITGFRQALSAVDGIDGVALSLGQTGEFVFRATHDGGFDVRSAITTLEGDGAKVEERPEGGLRVTLDRAR